MPEVNLLRNTESPELPPRPPRRPGDPELTNPSNEPNRLGRFFKSILGRPSAEPTIRARPALGQKNNVSRMGLGRSRPDQRIIQETKSNRPPVVPLPDEDDEGGFGVNLLSEDLVSHFKPQQKLLQLLGLAVGAAAVIGLLYFGLDLVQRSVTSDILEKQTASQQVSQQIDDLQSDQQAATAATNKIKAIQGLVERHTRWTKFFKKVEQNTLPTVFYGPIFTGDIKGELTFSATTDSFDSVAEQYLVFQQAVAKGDFISSFVITGAARTATPGGSIVTFTVSLTVRPEVFDNSLASSTTRTKP